MRARRRRRSAIVGILVLVFGVLGIAAACAPSKPPALDPGRIPPAQSPECSSPKPCPRYYIPLLGNPKDDVALRNKYIAAFGSACYIAAVTDTFNCFYKTWQAACADAVKIAEVFGAPAYATGYMCQPVPNGDYTLQVGDDVAVKITISFKADAPRQSPKIDVNGVPTEVNGPYRNLPEPAKVEPGRAFFCSTQKELILQANRDAHSGKLVSDLANYLYACPEKTPPDMCKEPTELKEGPPNDPEAAQVHHVVPQTDKRSCRWGTNSNKNAAVISRRLNQFLYNKEPPPDEVTKINAVSPSPP